MAWECGSCGYYMERGQPPPECPECGAPQEQLFWVNSEVDEEDGDYDEEAELLDELSGGFGDDAEDEDEDAEERVPELGEEFGAAFDYPRDDAYLEDEEE